MTVSSSAWSPPPLPYRLALLIACSLVFALWPTGEHSSPSAHFRGDDDFRVSGEPMRAIPVGEKVQLRLRLERGKTYVINETTTHVAKSFFEGQAKKPESTTTQYVSSISLSIRVVGGSVDEFECIGVILDFVGFKDESVESRTNTMFDAVREATRNVQFSMTLQADGTVKRMDNAALRHSIASALHTVGQLPLHLEHALSVNGEIFPANGASFNSVGKTRITGTVFRIYGDGCKRIPQDAYRKIVVLNRGGCDFQVKAQLAAKQQAEGIVVIDSPSENDDEAVRTYMVGEADVGDVASVIVSASTGRYIDQLIANSGQDFKLIILGGVQALLARHENSANRDDDDADFVNHLSRTQNDGLHDFIGLGFVVDEVIKSRFSVFPPQPISIGQTWRRSEMISNPANPEQRAILDEEYSLSLTRPWRPTDSDEQVGLKLAKRGDALAVVEFRAIEKRVHGEDLQGVSISKPSKDDAFFGRASFRGHDVQVHGAFTVHVPTGMILDGAYRTLAEAKKSVVMIDKVTKKATQVTAKVEVEATTVLWGGME